MTRYDKSVVTGAAVSAALIAIGDKFRHARMVAGAAQQHMPVSHFLLAAFMGLTLLITFVTYLFAPQPRVRSRS